MLRWWHARWAVLVHVRRRILVHAWWGMASHVRRPVLLWLPWRWQPCRRSCSRRPLAKHDTRHPRWWRSQLCSWQLRQVECWPSMLGKLHDLIINGTLRLRFLKLHIVVSHIGLVLKPRVMLLSYDRRFVSQKRVAIVAVVSGHAARRFRRSVKKTVLAGHPTELNCHSGTACPPSRSVKRFSKTPLR